ncbi:MAG: hypothetical protein GX883_01095, partial [Firmicutes bacterium]|nr:hypothetical protein [Bacillota bacterium]
AAGGELGRVLSQNAPVWSGGAAACVVLASGGYPGPYETGKPIQGLRGSGGGFDPGAGEGLALFHAGTALDENGAVVTAGGRVLGVTAWAAGLRRALDVAYRRAEQIEFAGRYYRRDIGHRAL